MDQVEEQRLRTTRRRNLLDTPAVTLVDEDRPFVDGYLLGTGTAAR